MVHSNSSHSSNDPAPELEYFDTISSDLDVPQEEAPQHESATASDTQIPVDTFQTEFIPEAVSEQLAAEKLVRTEAKEYVWPAKTVAHILCSVPEVVSAGSHLKGSKDGVALLVGDQVNKTGQEILSYAAQVGAMVAHSLGRIYCVVGILDNVMGSRPFWHDLPLWQRISIGIVAPPFTLASLVGRMNKTWRTNVGESVPLRTFWTSYTGILDLPEILYSNVLLLRDFMRSRYRKQVPARCRKARAAASHRCQLTILEMSEAQVLRGALSDVVAAHHRYLKDCACGDCNDASEVDARNQRLDDAGKAVSFLSASARSAPAVSIGAVDASAGDHHLGVDEQLLNHRQELRDHYNALRYTARADADSAEQLEFGPPATAVAAALAARDVASELSQTLLQRFGNQNPSSRSGDEKSESESSEDEDDYLSYSSSSSSSSSSDEKILDDMEMPLIDESVESNSQKEEKNKVISQKKRRRRRQVKEKKEWREPEEGAEIHYSEEEISLAVQHRLDPRLRLVRKILALVIGIPLALVTYLIKGISAGEGLSVFLPTWLAYIFAFITVASLAYIQWRLPVGFVKYVFDKLTLPRREHVRDPFYLYHPILSLLMVLVSLYGAVFSFFAAYNSGYKVLDKEWSFDDTPQWWLDAWPHIRVALAYLYGIHYVFYASHACNLTLAYGANKLKSIVDKPYRFRMAALKALQYHKESPIEPENTSPHDHQHHSSSFEDDLPTIMPVVSESLSVQAS